ncbi:MAG: metal ABC transporter permease [Opitutales bacterium]|nr:metal ABC transporter permease [Opitutales bacterium]
MRDFLELLFSSDVPFMRNAMIVGLLSSVAFGVIGSYVVVRRVSYLAGAIAHSSLLGIGAALFMRGRFGWTAADPLLGALIAALLSAFAVWWVSTYAKEREDAIIGAIWSVGMAGGLLFLSCTPGYVDAMSYLFGDVLLVGGWQMWLVAALDLAVLLLGIGLYNRFQALSFDEEFATVRGLPVKSTSLLLLCMVALTVVVLVSVAGIVLVVALLTLPAAAAGRISSSLKGMMIGATLIGVVTVPSGLFLSYNWDLPAGPLIVLLVAIVYLGSWLKGRKA